MRLMKFISASIVATLVVFFCFWDLGTKPIAAGDESIHIQVVQDILYTGQFYPPTLEGIPYFQKPPLKMWLSAGLVKTFGQTKFNYRVIDAFLGVLTALAVWRFSYHLTSRFWASLLGVFALLACRPFFLSDHGFRSAVQDSVVVCASTWALFFLYRWYEQASEADCSHDHRCHRDLYYSSLLIAAAVLSKSIAGFFPLTVFISFMLFNRSGRLLLAKYKRPLAIALLLTICFPALYFVPLFISSSFAVNEGLTVNIVNRLVTKGFHNAHNPLFYIESLFTGKIYPSLFFIIIFLGLLFGSVSGGRREHSEIRRKQLFIVFWLVVPVLLYSVLRSRLLWYIAPVFPAVAIGAALMVSSLGSFFETGKKKASIILILIGVVAVSSGGAQVLESGQALLKKKDNVPLENLIDELISLHDRGPLSSISLYDLPASPVMRRREKTYLNFLVPPARKIREFVMAQEGSHIVITHSSRVPALFTTQKPCGYQIIKNAKDQRSVIFFGLFGNCEIPLSGFRPLNAGNAEKFLQVFSKKFLG